MASGFRHVDGMYACRGLRDVGAERIRGGLVQTDVLITQLMVPEGPGLLYNERIVVIPTPIVRTG